MKEKKKFQDQFKKKLKELSDSLAELTSRAEQFQEDATLEFEEHIDSLRDKQHKVRAKT